MKMSQSPKPLSLVYLRLGGKIRETCETSYAKIYHLQFNIIIKRAVNTFNMKVLHLTIAWHEYDGGIG